MSTHNNEESCQPERVSSSPVDCPLSQGEQTRNLILYASNVALIYLAAPVVYVGITQAALCEKLGADKTISNMPVAIYFATTPLPIVVAWYFPHVRLLKKVLVGSYLIAAAAGAVVAAHLVVPTPAWVVAVLEWLANCLHVTFPPHWAIPAVLLHAAVLGCTLGVINTFQWEALGRGVSEARRGIAFSLAFGVGPSLAVIGSFASQVVLGGLNLGNTLGRAPMAVPYPWNFALLFAAAVPILVLAAILSTWFIIPQPPVEVVRLPFFSGIFGGLGEFLSYHLILLASLALILIGAGYSIISNLALYTKIATGEPAVQFAGYQNTLRFGFKVIAGLFLGWWLTKTNPKAGMLLTGAFCLASVLWALTVPGTWFLVAFGLMGAGELFGVYYPNYIFSCSAKSRMRRNMAFANMLNMFLALPPVLYGWIADHFGEGGAPGVVGTSAIGMLASPSGQGSFLAAATFLGGEMVQKRGFQMSFFTSGVLSTVALLLVFLFLPARPRPRPCDMAPSDQVREISEREDAPGIIV